MRNRSTTRRIIWNGLVGLLFILVLLLFENLLSQEFQECAQTQATGYYSQSGEFVRVIIPQFICSVRFIDKHAALALAVFTFTLWRSTDALWRAGEGALETTERAFVFLDDFRVELTTAIDKGIPIEELPERYRDRPGLFITRFAAQPRWKNSGSTPTKNLIIQVHWQGPGGRIPPEYNYSNPGQTLFIGPNATQYSDVIDMSAAPRALVDFGAFNPGGAEPYILIWGRADYDDIFGSHHFIKWCYRLRLEAHRGDLSAHFIQWGDYNSSNE